MAKGFDSKSIEYQSKFFSSICTFFQDSKGLPLLLAIDGSIEGRREQAERSFADRLTSSLVDINNRWYLRERKENG